MIKNLQDKADLFRKEHNISATEPINIENLLLELGILVVYKPMSDSFSGMAIISGSVKAILINSLCALGRQNFTIAHEIYHLFIQEKHVPHLCVIGQFDKKEVEEYRADIFATNFLLPLEGIKQHIPPSENKNTISPLTILKISTFFGSSWAFTLRRLTDCGFLSKARYEELKILSPTYVANQYGYPTHLYKPTEEKVVGNFGEISKTLYDKGIISESHYYELMNAIGVELNLDENGKED